jgi:hypothetical protein
MMGIPRCVDSAPLYIPFTIFTHASGGAFFAGTLPPPLSTLPARTTDACKASGSEEIHRTYVFTIHVLKACIYTPKNCFVILSSHVIRYVDCETLFTHSKQRRLASQYYHINNNKI